MTAPAPQDIGATSSSVKRASAPRNAKEWSVATMVVTGCVVPVQQRSPGVLLAFAMKNASPPVMARVAATMAVKGFVVNAQMAMSALTAVAARPGAVG